MADESQSKDLLASLSNTRLPVTSPSRQEPQEPAEPREPREVEARGKSPEEVVRPHETPTETPAEETVLPAAPKKAKKEAAPVKVYEIDGASYTKEQLEEAGLLDRIVQTSRQFPSIQKKYVELLEEKKATPAQTEEQPAPPPVITNEVIARAYDAPAQQIINDLLKSNLLDEDLEAAYPRSIKTFTGQIRYIADELFQLKAQAQEAIKRLEATIAYLNRNKTTQESNVVQSEFNKQLDALVAKDGKLYAGLADSKTRADFQTFLVEEVQASVGQTTGPAAQNFLSRQWVAFNGPTITEAAKNAQKDKQNRQDKRFVYGEHTGSRPGIPDDGDKPMLDRMIDNSGRIRE